MTEHELQERLVTQWCADGLVLDGERLFLAAWEVMSDYTVNDSRLRWNLPSVDFVLVDAAGRMVVLEIKPSVTRPRECWSVLCQVTHRATVLAEAFRPERLEAVHALAWSGVHGRLPPGAASDGLRLSAARFFEDPAWTPIGLPARRVVAASVIGSRFASIRSTFELDEPAARAAISGYADTRELRRFLALGPRRPELVADGVSSFECAP